MTPELRRARQYSSAQAQAIARDLYGIDATAEPLDGEFDENFHIHDSAGSWILKIMRAGCSRDFVAMQIRALEHLRAKLPGKPLQEVRPSAAGEQIIEIENGRLVWALTWLPGIVMDRWRPHTPELLESFGALLGDVGHALADFDHPTAHREFQWDLSRPDWIRAYMDRIQSAARRQLAERVLEVPALAGMRRAVIHGDANLDNVLVAGGRISGLIDFGDLHYGATVADVAIAAAYTAWGSRDFLPRMASIVRGYHKRNPLTEAEVALLFPLALARLAVSALSSEMNREPAEETWRTLERLDAISPELAHYTLRHACGLDPVPHSRAVVRWLDENAAGFAGVLGGIDARESMVFDLSAGSLMLGADPKACETPRLTSTLFGGMCDEGVRVGIGRYNEARMLYQAPGFASGPHPTDEHRTVHLGLDLFVEAGTPVHAPIEGAVELVANNTARGGYGPLVILRHDAKGTPFYTLYGHLTEESLAHLRAGQSIARGERFATIGGPPTNGDYPPHLHLQIITDLLGLGRDFPGVALPSQCDVFLSLSPDPNLITQIPAKLFPAPDPPLEGTRAARREHLGRNLSVSYHPPLKIVRGWRQYLYDHEGQAYLDVYNNVPLVGHSHPKVVEAASRQLALLNTNTRYLHDTIVRYAERLKSKLPASLSVCYFVNSGSEAVELALRMARSHVRGKDVIVLDHAYHGITNSAVNMSPHKFNGPGGGGAKPWIHVAPLGDAGAVGRIIDDEIPAKRGLCAFLAESLPSVAGQIVFPPGYLRDIYRSVRAAGGVSIADEVQTGFGRLGQWFWGFEMQDVVPDIAIFGKAMGNGFPIAGVAVTAEIAASFDNGMEFFSTYGGNPVACAAGLAVLEVLEEEGLQENARRVGAVWMESLRALARRYPVITDVRGAGLFLGVELDRDASYVVNRLRDRHILTGADGPRNNVIKLRPPLVFTEDDAQFFVQVLEEILEEGS